MSAGVLVIAMVLDALMGEPRWLWDRVPHPAVLMGRAVGWLDQRLNKGDARRAMGVVAVVVLGLGAVVLGSVLQAFGPVVEILVAAILLAQRSLVQHVQAVSDALRLSTGDARRSVARIVSRDTTMMGPSDITRSAIESASENLSDGVIAPAFWMLIGGLPGLILYKVVNTADSMIGYRTPKYEQFGWAAARLDDLLNLIPARLTGVLIALVSGRISLWPEISRDARRHRSPNAGWPEAAMARALGVALAGPRAYDGRMQQFPWVHDEGRRDLIAADIDATLSRLWQVWALWLAVCIVIALI